MMEQKMIVIDGSQGEGGGQILRSSISLAMCLGKSVRIKNIRAGRKKPGLLRQHLTCLRAAREICNAELSGDELRSAEISFVPGKIQAGNYRFAIGSAGSTSLVFQTVFPALLCADDVSEVRFEGGTHNGMAPSFDFIQQSFLPLLKAMGFHAEISLQDFGFYPAGGGAWVAKIYPSGETRALNLDDRGELLEYEAVATSARIPEHVTERQLEQVHKRCVWEKEVLEQRLVSSRGPGNIVSLRARYQNTCAVFEAVGEKSLSAERVAGRAIKAFATYKDSQGAACEYLADQLLLPMVLGSGGSFTTGILSDHLKTNCDVIEKFIEGKITIEKISADLWRVKVKN